MEGETGTSNTDGHTSANNFTLSKTGDTNFSTEINAGPTFKVEKVEVNSHIQNSKPSIKKDEKLKEKALTDYKQEL